MTEMTDTERLDLLEHTMLSGHVTLVKNNKDCLTRYRDNRTAYGWTLRASIDHMQKQMVDSIATRLTGKADPNA